MAKRATKSKNSSSAPASSADSGASKPDSNKELVLAAKTNENARRSARQTVANRRGGELSRKKSRTNAKSTQKKKIKKIDANKPKKPPTAFFYYLEDFRKEYQEQNPDVKSMRDIGKACGEKWKTMTYEEKVKYYDIATEKRAEFDRTMAEYLKRKELGDYQESEDDSDD